MPFNLLRRSASFRLAAVLDPSALGFLLVHPSLSFSLLPSDARHAMLGLPHLALTPHPAHLALLILSLLSLGSGALEPPPVRSLLDSEARASPGVYISRAAYV